MSRALPPRLRRPNATTARVVSQQRSRRHRPQRRRGTWARSLVVLRLIRQHGRLTCPRARDRFGDHHDAPIATQVVAYELTYIIAGHGPITLAIAQDSAR